MSFTSYKAVQDSPQQFVADPESAPQTPATEQSSKEPQRTDPEFKMGIGQRILGVANNFLQGMAHRPAVTKTGRGAINEGKYDVARSKWLDQARKVTAAGAAGQATGTQFVSGGAYDAAKSPAVDAGQG